MLFRSADLQFMAPGSTTAEITSLHGYKPPTISMAINPAAPGSAHFVENTKVLKKHLPAVEIRPKTDVPIGQSFRKKLFNKLTDLETKTKEIGRAHV